MSTAKATFRIEGEDATAAAWKSAVSNAQHSAEKMQHAFEAAFAGISVAAIVELGKKAFETGDQLAKGAIKAGIGGKAFSELAYAAKLADVDVTALSKSIKTMQVSLSNAASGVKAPKDDLRALGLTLKDVSGLKTDEQFELIGERISQLKDPADRARAATDLFGKAGADLLPLFEKGAAGIRAAREEAEHLGVAFNDEQLKKLSEAEDATKKLSAAWQGFYMLMATKVAPTITDVLDALTGTRRSQLVQQIKFLEAVKGEGFVAANPLGARGAFPDIAGIHSAQEGAALLAKLQGELDLTENLHPELGGRGVHTGAAPAHGFASIAADAEAQKAQDDFAKGIDGIEKQWDEQIASETKQQNDAWTDSMVDWQKFEDERLKVSQETSDEIAKYQQEQAEKSSAAIKGLFMDAFDDMINTGKIHWRELMKYFLAEIAKSQLSKALDDIFANFGSKGSSSGGFWSSVGGWIAGALGSGKASGGPVSAGTIYPVGEHGPELFAPGVNGSIIPNSAMMGGGPSIIINNNVDARGASGDLVKALPKILDQSSKATEARIIDRMRRGFYPQLAR